MQHARTKVLLAITKSNFGGAQRYVLDLATNLPKDRYDVAVLSGGEGLLRERLEAAKVRTLSLPRLGRDVRVWNDLVSFIEMIRIFRHERPDVLHLNSSKMGILGALAGRLSGVPRIVFTGHGWAFNEDRPRWQKTVIAGLHMLTIRLSHITIGVSESTLRGLPFLGALAAKTTVVYNGVGSLAFKARETARTVLSERLGRPLPAEAFIAGTISELHPNKGISYALQGIAQARERLAASGKSLLFVVLGGGQDKAVLEAEIEKLGLRNVAFLAGFVPDASLYLKAFDVFTLTSITEAFPYTILEAAHAGLPIVASDVGGIAEAISDMGSGILLQPKRPDEIANALCFLAENPDKAKAFGIAARKKAGNDFTIHSMVKATCKAYEGAL